MPLSAQEIIHSVLHRPPHRKTLSKRVATAPSLCPRLLPSMQRLQNLLRNRAYASKRARKFRIEWGTDQEQAFICPKDTLLSPLVLTFLSWNHSYTLHTDATSVGAGAVLTQMIDGMELVFLFASHRFSRSDANWDPRKQSSWLSCMLSDRETDTSWLTLPLLCHEVKVLELEPFRPLKTCCSPRFKRWCRGLEP